MMELTPEEEAVLNNLDMEPILGSIQDRLQHAMEMSVRFMRERNELQSRINGIAVDLEKIVCTEGEDKGVVLLSQDGPTHVEEINGRRVTVYDLEYFSLLGEALIAVHDKCLIGERESRNAIQDKKAQA